MTTFLWANTVLGAVFGGLALLAAMFGVTGAPRGGAPVHRNSDGHLLDRRYPVRSAERDLPGQRAGARSRAIARP
jgi:hypothetical protein